MQGAGTLQPGGSRRREPTIPASEVARAVVYMASLPLEANVLFMTVTATAMPYVGRGDKTHSKIGFQGAMAAVKDTDSWGHEGATRTSWV